MPIKQHKCLRCGWEWESWNPHPLRCAKCKSPYYDQPYRMKKYLYKNKPKDNELGFIEAGKLVGQSLKRKGE